MALAFPQVRGRIERISDPTTASQAVQQTGYSDEGRLYALTQELPKLWDAPVIGVGFFNRGDPSELDPSGSHNFFAQIALETGLLGLLFLLWLLWGLWKVKSPPEFKRPLAAFHATVVAICIACLSGEYLYGGLNLMLLSLLSCSTIALYQRGAARAAAPIAPRAKAAVRAPVS
jgi:O-antigen ligase